MYTLLDLQSKTFGELKKIGYELNVLPKGDRRYRQSWIDAIAGVNPPLLQLLEVSAAVEVPAQEPPIVETVETSPGVEVDRVSEAPLESKFGRIVYPRPVQEAIARVAETSPGVEVDRVQEAIEQVAKTSPGVEVDRALNYKFLLCLEEEHNILWYDGKNFASEKWSAKTYCKRGAGAAKHQLRFHPKVKRLGNLQVVENSSAERKAIEVQAQGAIVPVAEKVPGVEVDRVQEPFIETVETSTGVDRPPIRKSHPARKLTRLPKGALGYSGWLQTLTLAQLKKFAAERGLFLDSDNPQKWVEAILGCIDSFHSGLCLVDSEGFELGFLPPSVDNYLNGFTEAENSPGVEVDPLDDVPECSNCFGDGYVGDEFGRVKFCQCEPKLSRQKTQSAIVPAAKNLPSRRSKTSAAHQLLELFKSSAHIIEGSPSVEAEPRVSQSAIAPVIQNRIEEDSDLNPILTKISLSDRFLTRYSPPQPENIRFRVDADGQLSLLDFEVQSEPEPPDPDDFESLDAFREAIALWDAEHPSSSDLLPSSEDNDASSQDNDASSQDNDASSQDKPLEVSLDSFCEWAPCPDEWYEPVALIEQSKVSELLPGCKSSITSDFSIPTFDCWGDRPNKNDEPPDTWIYAKLPKPKPPKFPPQAIGHTHTKRKLNAFQLRNFDRSVAPQTHIKSSSIVQVETGSKCRANTYPPIIPINNAAQSKLKHIPTQYPETIPKLFHRIAACSRTQPA